MIQVDKYVVGGAITLNKPLTLTVKQGLLVVCLLTAEIELGNSRAQACTGL